ncbi:helix-turn-helix domain-containing protein [Hymenobacter cellulosilyticus]|uniref:Helix-turn-helix domain-containing protein n=1 Tax=Hymenobacter cellulosilyticus TaxID=2932248 RepID=A0A8T9QE68_9BACT|nr:helix-turn-helix domain-containing protein [Hymenobacter cellulosilyticus]UOQ74120.1 helix-turn-helix domain-containing protein [Hymenobacter cellulosilyticus]
MFAPSQSGASMLSGLIQALSPLIEQIVEEKLAVRLDSLTQQYTVTQPPNEWLTVKEAALFFDVVPQTIHRWSKKGTISRFKLEEKGTTYYSKAELNAALKQQVRPDGTRKHARRQFQKSAV